jgi:hypothetical protein
LVAKGKVHNENLLKRNLMKKAFLFQQITRGIEASEVGSWSPFRIRLDLTVAADATVSGMFARAGGEVRVRFEWKRSLKETDEKKTLGKIAEGSRKLLNNLAGQIAKAVKEEPASKKLLLENFNVSIGVSLSGDVGIAEASGEIVTQVYFKSTKEEDFHTIRSNGIVETNTNIPFLKTNQTKSLQQLTLINSDNLRKGLKKAVRFAEYFPKKLSKEKYKKSDWAVYSIAPSFTFALNGDVGLTTIEGTSGLELEYENTNF